MRDFQSLPDLHQAEPIPEAARRAIDEMLSSGDLFRYTTPQDNPVSGLEQAFADALGTRFALAVSSCSAALFLSLKALDLPRDARVLIPAFTFAAVPSAVVHADCRPVLVDMSENYRIDINDLRTKALEADAILISHMRGHTSDMDAIFEVAAQHGLPVIEDAAHSLGTTWDGQNIGTMGKIGCFSFQSYKMLNAGEGGLLVTDDPNVIARAVIMSGAYEHQWKHHALVESHVERWQNKLPLYNLRMQNISAAVIRPQLDALPERVTRGRRNHDHLAARLNTDPAISVPDPLPKERRAPDSIQFNLVDLSDAQVDAFQNATAKMGLPVQIFGRSKDNARAFWNWQFLDDLPDLPRTRAMLMRACDVRLPVRLEPQEVDVIADILLSAAQVARAQP